MIGFTRTKRGQPSSVGFRKLRFPSDEIVSTAGYDKTRIYAGKKRVHEVAVEIAYVRYMSICQTRRAISQKIAQLARMRPTKRPMIFASATYPRWTSMAEREDSDNLGSTA